MTPEEQKELNKQLLAVCKREEKEETVYAGNVPILTKIPVNTEELVAEVTALLEKGAGADGNGDGLPLIWAANNGHMEVVKLLLEAGADAALVTDYDGKPAEYYAGCHGHRDIEKLLKEYREGSPDEVVFRRLVSGSLLEEAFNFKTLERISILHSGEAVSFQRDSFSAVEDKETLRKAFNEHVKRGGKLTEEEALSGAKKLDKNPSL